MNCASLLRPLHVASRLFAGVRYACRLHLPDGSCGELKPKLEVCV